MAPNWIDPQTLDSRQPHEHQKYHLDSNSRMPGNLRSPNQEWRGAFLPSIHTPFASGPVADVLGPFELNEVSQQILHGKFDIGSISDDIQLHSIIKAMSHSDPTNPIEADSKLTIKN
jgi:hypothetical protein